jgi:hypothetical protein
MSTKKEIRWYKGKYKVEVVLKSRGNWRVKALENMPFTKEGNTFTTPPRLLWRRRRHSTFEDGVK